MHVYFTILMLTTLLFYIVVNTSDREMSLKLGMPVFILFYVHYNIFSKILI